jgi:hypothetical protein
MNYPFVDLEYAAGTFSSPIGINSDLEYARGRFNFKKPTVKGILNRARNASTIADRYLPKEVRQAREYGFNTIGKGSRRIRGWMGADGSGSGFATLTPFDGEQDLEFAKGKGKAFFSKVGKGIVKGVKIGASLAANSGLLPGGPLVQALAERIGTPPTPAGVVQGAQSPAESAAVVAAIAPSLPAPQAAQAAQLVASANNSADAQSVAQALMNAQASSLAKKSKNKTLLYIGGGLALAVIVVLGIVLARRK